MVKNTNWQEANWAESVGYSTNVLPGFELGTNENKSS